MCQCEHEFSRSFGEAKRWHCEKLVSIFSKSFIPGSAEFQNFSGVRTEADVALTWHRRLLKLTFLLASLFNFLNQGLSKPRRSSAHGFQFQFHL